MNLSLERRKSEHAIFDHGHAFGLSVAFRYISKGLLWRFETRDDGSVQTDQAVHKGDTSPRVKALLPFIAGGKFRTWFISHLFLADER